MKKINLNCEYCPDCLESGVNRYHSNIHCACDCHCRRSQIINLQEELKTIEFKLAQAWDRRDAMDHRELSLLRDKIATKLESLLKEVK